VPEPFTLFEVSWEVCNKVGGIHTVLSTKAKTLVERLGDDAYLTVGPWLLSESDANLPFDDEPGFEATIDACRALGVPVRVGRWRIPGAPRTMLVSFSGQYPHRDEILAKLWLRFGVDSLGSQWDYIEPVLFGHAAGLAIEQWWRMFRRGLDSRAVVQCHEWLTASALLYLSEREPGLATVFTTHATVLGRAASAAGLPLDDGPPTALADKLNVRSKHSLESTAAGAADVFTTVSRLTAEEALRVLDRAAHPILPNGIDLDVSDALVAGVTRSEAQAALRRLAERFLGTGLREAAMVGISGRYEFRNKGIDLLLDALDLLNQAPGRPIVLFVFVPAGNSGLRADVAARLSDDEAAADGPLGLATHNLFDPASDPVQRHCLELGLDNRPSHRVKVIQVPIYLHAQDGLLGMSYEAALQGLDLTCFPSAYEPWGYTPQESLAAGVPTVTSDCAGFGRWCQDNGLDASDGVQVLTRAAVHDDEAARALAEMVADFVSASRDLEATVRACRRTAARVSWSDLIGQYDEAFALALERATARLRTQAPGFAPTVRVPERADGDGTGPRLFPFNVRARLPRALDGLARLAGNYWWSTDAEAERLFERLDPAAWARCGGNPLALIRSVAPDVVAERAAAEDFVRDVQRVTDRFDAYMDARPEAGGASGPTPEHPLAYFSAEFGIHESLPVYSGGLGVLAGDHLKSASDLGVATVAVSLFYHKGFFRQRVTAAGEQVAHDVPLDPRALPLQLVDGPDGRPLDIVIRLPDGHVHLCAWRAMVGRVPLYLLDANLPANRPEDRAITRNLYSADQETRLRQEILLGKGGVRLLRALGTRPSVFHLNEGHAALAGLERVAELVRGEGLTFDQAHALVRATTVFTTHTPVAAGHDRFEPDLMRRYFSDAPSWIGVPWERFFALGQQPDDPGHFNMTGLAIRMAGAVNAVSRLHGRVSRELLGAFWPHLLHGDVPIRAVTNGVHLNTWTHPDLTAELIGRGRPLRGEDFAAHAPELSDDRLWAVRNGLRARLMAAARRHLEQRFVERHDSPRLLASTLAGLDPDALVIGVARRFAPYKRADLLFRDPDRLTALLDDPERPVRVLYAGKAHPNDDLGQQILRRVVMTSREPRFVGKVVFLEDHDMALARTLVQGCDVWLNTPRHQLEASGTSGMKSAANGGLHLSIADGWWGEGFRADNGWVIGGDRVYEDQELQDELDSTRLYQMLEEEVVPLFYERAEGGPPSRWLERVRCSLATIPTYFNTDRMVAEYRDGLYMPMARRGLELSADRYERLQRTVGRHQWLRRSFANIRIAEARIADLDRVHAGDTVAARLVLTLGDLAADDVAVELVVGRPSHERRLDEPQVVRLQPSHQQADGWVFEAQHVVQQAGPLAYGIRVRAAGVPPEDDVATELVLWA